jgi:hypothetical protein
LLTVLKKPRSIAYLTSCGGDLAVHRRREAHAVADLHGDGLAVLGHLRVGLGEVRHRRLAVVGLPRVQRALGGVAHHVAHLVVGDAGIDVVHIVGPQHRQLPALLLDGRTAVGAPLGAALAATAREDRAGESEREERAPGHSMHRGSFLRQPRRVVDRTSLIVVRARGAHDDNR